MPIIHKSSLNQSVSLVIWKITETESELLNFLHLNEEELADLNTIKVDARRLEWLGARNALKVLVKSIGQFYIYKDTHGKPHLRDTEIGISVSHAKGYGAAAINLNGEVGIDIEWERQQIHRIAKRFLHKTEIDWSNDDATSLTKIWAAKEALYKLHGRTQLTFSQQLTVTNFNFAQQSRGTILEEGETASFQLDFFEIEGLHVCCAH